MTKTRLNICVETEVYLQAKALNMNMSNAINDILKTFVNTLDDNPEKEELIKKLGKLEEQKEDLQKQITLAKVQLQRLDQEEEQEQAEELHKKELMVQSIRAARILEDS